MDDLISRKQAIDAIEEIVSSMSVCLNRGERRGMKRMQGNAVDVIKELPTAEPQIIHCKDCKHRPVVEEGYDEEKWDSGFCLDFPDNVCPCGCDDYFYNWLPKDDFYCGFAERM